MKVVANTESHVAVNEVETKISKMPENIIEHSELVQVCRIDIEASEDRIDDFNENQKEIAEKINKNFVATANFS